MTIPSLRDANIVVLARSYNPSIISKEWLERKKIITEPVVNFLHAPPLSHVETTSLRLVVHEERLQVGLRQPEGMETARLQTAVRAFVTALPETPYTAVGFNFALSVPVADCRLVELLRPDDAAIRGILGSPYALGILLSFQFRSYRVRMTAPPPQAGEPKSEGLVLDFNFHAAADGAREVKTKLRDYVAALDKARDVAGGVCK